MAPKKRNGKRKNFKNKRNKGKGNRMSRNRNKEVIEIETEVEFEQSPASYFMKVVSYKDHFDAQQKYRNKYLATILELLNRKIEILQSAKVRILAAAWARNDLDMSRLLLSMKKIFNFVEVSKAVSILDRRRCVTAIEKKINKLKENEANKKITVKESTYVKLKNKVERLNKTKLDFGSVSGALARHIREWVRGFSKEELEFMVKNFDKQPWRELADIIHFHPEKDFVNLPWFLNYCYGQEAPEDSVVCKTKDVTVENVNQVIAESKMTFHETKMYGANLTTESKKKIVEDEDTVSRAIWWYEELECDAVNEVIDRRLREELDSFEMNYGKIMERLMMLKPKNVSFFPMLLEIAEKKLKSYSHNLEGPIAVLADASASMEVAIKTATIVSSFLTVFTNARMIYFNNKAWEPERKPTNISDVIELALGTKASCCTSPAAALNVLYEEKVKMKTIFIITDEEENTNCKGFPFARLYKKYIEEICNCRLIFVSFLHSQHDKGQMVDALHKEGIFDVTQYVMNRSRPDISKLDNIIGRLSMHTGAGSAFMESIEGFRDRLDNGEPLSALFSEYVVTNNLEVEKTY